MSGLYIMKRFSAIFILILSLIFIQILPGIRVLYAQNRVTIYSKTGESLFQYSGYYVLVIGVGNYDSEFWPDEVKNIEDAREIAGFFEQWEHFQVNTLIDPTVKEINKALEIIRDEVGIVNDKAIIFYFTGRCYTETSTDGSKHGWIIPKDCPGVGDDGFKKIAVGLEKIDTIFSHLKSMHVLSIFNAAFTDSSILAEIPKLENISAKTGWPVRQFIISGSEGDAITENNIFLRFLLRGLEGHADKLKDGAQTYITGSELGEYIYMFKQVTEGGQNPQYGKTTKARYRGGDIVLIFKRRPETTAICVTVSPSYANVNILELNKGMKDKECKEVIPGRYTIEATAPWHIAKRKVVDLERGKKEVVVLTLSEIEEYTNSIGMQFKLIKPGAFAMGSPDNEPGRFNDEDQHTVKITQGFFMQTTEVTLGHFRKFVEETGYKTEAEKGRGCWVLNRVGLWEEQKQVDWSSSVLGQKKGDNYPAACISWNDAYEFTKWLSRKEGKEYSLPTEAEWEYACRAGGSKPFGHLDCLNSNKANFSGAGAFFKQCEKTRSKTQDGPVTAGAISPNKWGLYDMHGNLLEWCRDWYDKYNKKITSDPKGPTNGMERVLRGGHWSIDLNGLRAAKRWRLPPDTASDVIGFRVVLNID